MSSRITLPQRHVSVDRSQEPLPADAPTWARRRVAAGQFVRLQLAHRSDHVDDDGTRTEVWVVPADAWSPGDDIEFVPIPPGVRVDVEVADTYAVTAAFPPAPVPRQ